MYYCVVFGVQVPGPRAAPDDLRRLPEADRPPPAVAPPGVGQHGQGARSGQLHGGLL